MALGVHLKVKKELYGIVSDIGNSSIGTQGKRAESNIKISIVGRVQDIVIQSMYL